MAETLKHLPITGSENPSLKLLVKLLRFSLEAKFKVEPTILVRVETKLVDLIFFLLCPLSLLRIGGCKSIWTLENVKYGIKKK